MDAKKKKQLASAGWQIGEAADFLNLSPADVAYIEMKIVLGQCVRNLRSSKKLTQVQLAKIIQSSQSRVARMETGDPSVSLDLQIKTILALGASQKDLAGFLRSK